MQHNRGMPKILDMIFGIDDVASPILIGAYADILVIILYFDDDISLPDGGIAGQMFEYKVDSKETYDELMQCWQQGTRILAERLLQLSRIRNIDGSMKVYISLSAKRKGS